MTFEDTRAIVELCRLDHAEDAAKLPMQTIKYVYWQEDDDWLGYLEEYPDYWTQGDTFDDLVEHLKDLYLDLTSGQIPGIRKVGQLVVP